MKSKLFIAIITVCMFTFFFGCSANPEQSGTHTLVQSEDGRLSIEIPEYWKKSTIKLNAEAQIAVSMENEEKYVILIDEDRKAFEDDMKLKDYYDIVVENVAAGLEDSEFGDLVDMHVNGNEAFLVEIKGTVNDINVVYWLMVVNSKDSFTQVIGWTVLGRYEQNKQEILGVLKSFRKNNMENILANADMESSDSERTIDVADKDRRMAITVPADWNKSDGELNEEANIAVSLREKDKFVVVVNHKKDAFNDSITLTDYYNIIVANVLKTMENYEFCEPIDTELNGRDAILVGIKGSINKVEIAYWIYAVEAEDSFTHISGWTLYSKADENRDSVLNVMKSFVIDE